MNQPQWTRRHLLLSGGLMALGGCGRAVGYRYDPPSGPMIDPDVYHYTVRPGDTLYAISRRSGLSVPSIASVNRLSSAEIHPGEVLRLPGVKHLRPDPVGSRAASDTDASARAVRDKMSAGGYRLIGRSQWTTDAVKSNIRPIGRVGRLTVHHTGEHGKMATMPDIEVVRVIERYHRNERKWAAIGYHYVVGRDGDVFEGRPARFQGAHVAGANTQNIGISMIGDFHRNQPSVRQLASLKSFLTDQRQRYGLGRDRVFGHRDLGNSICPGDHLYAWVKRYQRGAV
jgi:LysM repeat protein